MSDQQDSTIECPKCAETIKAKATICRFCGHELKTESEKVYLKEPVLVTSSIVKIPWRNKYQPDSTIRVQDIESVGLVKNSRAGGLWGAALLVLVMPGCTTLLGGGGATVFWIVTGMAVLVAGFTLLKTFSYHLSNVKIKTAGGRITWYSGKSLEEGAAVKNAINEAIENSTK